MREEDVLRLTNIVAPVVFILLVTLILYGFFGQPSKEAQLRSLKEDSFIMDVLIFRVEHCSQQPLQPMMQDVCAEAERIFDDSVQRRKELQ